MPIERKPAQEQWIANVGMDYPHAETGQPVRVEEGEPCVGLPEKSVKWLKDRGQIRPAAGEPAGKAGEDKGGVA